MKKWMQLAVAGLIVVSMASCKAGNQQSQSGEMVSESAVTEDSASEDAGSKNDGSKDAGSKDAGSEDDASKGAASLTSESDDFEEVDGPEFFKELGVKMEAPKKADHVTCGVIDGKVCQISFQLDQQDYTYRGASGTADPSGIAEEFEPDVTALSDCGADEDLIIRTTVSGGRLANWSKRGAGYTLYTSDSVADETMFALCIELIGKN